MSRSFVLGLMLLIAITGLVTAVRADAPPREPTAGQYRVFLPLQITPPDQALPAAAEAEAAFTAFAQTRSQRYACTAPVVRDTALDSIAQALIAGPVSGLTVRGFGSFDQAAPFPLPSQLWQGCERESPELADGPMLRAGLAYNPATGTWLVVIDR